MSPLFVCSNTLLHEAFSFITASLIKNKSLPDFFITSSLSMKKKMAKVSWTDGEGVIAAPYAHLIILKNIQTALFFCKDPWAFSGFLLLPPASINRWRCSHTLRRCAPQDKEPPTSLGYQTNSSSSARYQRIFLTDSCLGIHVTGCGHLDVTFNDPHACWQPAGLSLLNVTSDVQQRLSGGVVHLLTLSSVIYVDYGFSLWFWT